MPDLPSLAAEALASALWISLPLLALALAAGLLVSLAQWALRASEPSLAALGRALSLGAALTAVAPWIYSEVVVFTTRLYEYLPSLAR